MKTDFSPFCSTLYFSKGTAAVFYSSDITPLHSHNTLQLVFDINGSFLFRTADTNWKKYRSLIIREDVTHQLNTNGGLQLIIYLDASGSLAKQISHQYLREAAFCDPGVELSPFEEVLFQRNIVDPKPGSIDLLVELLLSKLTNVRDTGMTDERIASVLRQIKQTDCRLLSIDYLADRACISPSRLRTQFKQQVGIPIHQYIIRQRIFSAITAIINGSTIQQAAFEAGFNDSSHFNKLMIKVCGINPSDFVKENQNGFTIQGDQSFALETRSPVAV